MYAVNQHAHTIAITRCVFRRRQQVRWKWAHRLSVWHLSWPDAPAAQRRPRPPGTTQTPVFTQTVTQHTHASADWMQEVDHTKSNIYKEHIIYFLNMEINCIFFKGHLTKITINRQQQKQDIKDFSFHMRCSDAAVHHYMDKERCHEELTLERRDSWDSSMCSSSELSISSSIPVIFPARLACMDWMRGKRRSPGEKNRKKLMNKLAIYRCEGDGFLV